MIATSSTISGNASKKLGANILKLHILYLNIYIYVMYIYIVYALCIYSHLQIYTIFFILGVKFNPSNDKEAAEVGYIKSNKQHLTGGKQIIQY